jgi:DNA-binding protein HU-beta
MKKMDLLEKIAKEAKISKIQAERALDTYYYVITDQLKKGDTVTASRFGTFHVITEKGQAKAMAKRRAKAMAKKSAKTISAKKIVFKPGKDLRPLFKESTKKN